MTKYLNNFVAARTHQAEEIQNALLKIEDARSFDVYAQEQFLAKAAYLNLGTSILSYSFYNSLVRIGFRDADFIRVQLPFAGKARVSIGSCTVEANEETVVCSPAEGIFELGSSIEQFIVRVKQTALERDIINLIGIRPKKAISFALATGCQLGPARRLQTIVTSAVSSVDASKDPIPSALLQEIDQTIRLAILYGIPNNFSDFLYAAPKLSAPWQVKRVEEWIDAHWRESISIEKLVEVSGSSVRSIFATFERARDYTPMAYLKQVRLNAGREMLQKAEPGTTVNGVSFSCNFKNSGNFARDYRLQFGEFPSDTLRRAKAR